MLPKKPSQQSSLSNEEKFAVDKTVEMVIEVQADNIRHTYLPPKSEVNKAGKKFRKENVNQNKLEGNKLTKREKEAFNRQGREQFKDQAKNAKANSFSNFTKKAVKAGGVIKDVADDPTPRGVVIAGINLATESGIEALKGGVTSLVKKGLPKLGGPLTTVIEGVMVPTEANEGEDKIVEQLRAQGRERFLNSSVNASSSKKEGEKETTSVSNDQPGESKTMPNENISRSHMRAAIEEAFGELGISSQTIENTIRGALEEPLLSLQELYDEANEIKDWLNQEKEDKANKVELQQINQFFDFGHSLAALTGCKEIQVVMTLTQSILTGYQAVSALIEVGKSLLSGLSGITAGAVLGPVGMLGGAVMTIIGLFMDSGPNPTQILLERLNGLSEQLQDLEKHMGEYFKKNYENQALILEVLQTGFAHLHAHIDHKIDDMRGELRDSLQTLQASVNLLVRLTTNATQDQFLFRFNELATTTESWMMGSGDGERPARSIPRLTTKLANWAITHAKTDMLTGEGFWVANPNKQHFTFYQQANEYLELNHREQGLNSWIGFLNAYAQYLCPERVGKSNSQKLPNPCLWHNAASRYLQLKMSFYTFDNDRSGAELKRIEDQGKAVKDFIDDLKQDEKFWNALLNEYHESLVAVKTAIDDYVQKKSDELIAERNNIYSKKEEENQQQFETTEQEKVKYSLCLMSENDTLEKNKLYVKIEQDKLHYKVLDPFSKLQSSEITTAELEHPIDESLTLVDFKPLLPAILRITSKRGHTQNVSTFSIFYGDLEQLSMHFEGKRLNHLGKNLSNPQSRRAYRALNAYLPRDLLLAEYLGIISFSSTATGIRGAYFNGGGQEGQANGDLVVYRKAVEHTDAHGRKFWGYPQHHNGCGVGEGAARVPGEGIPRYSLATHDWSLTISVTLQFNGEKSSNEVASCCYTESWANVPPAHTTFWTKNSEVVERHGVHYVKAGGEANFLDNCRTNALHRFNDMSRNFSLTRNYTFKEEKKIKQALKTSLLNERLKVIEALLNKTGGSEEQQAFWHALARLDMNVKLMGWYLHLMGKGTQNSPFEHLLTSNTIIHELAAYAKRAIHPQTKEIDLDSDLIAPELFEVIAAGNQLDFDIIESLKSYSNLQLPALHPYRLATDGLRRLDLYKAWKKLRNQELPELARFDNVEAYEIKCVAIQKEIFIDETYEQFQEINSERFNEAKYKINKLGRYFKKLSARQYEKLYLQIVRWGEQKALSKSVTGGNLVNHQLKADFEVRPQSW